MSSFLPLAYHAPGLVTVEVVSSTGSYLGETSFEYIDAFEFMFKKLEHDQELHSRFFHLMTQEMRNALKKTEKGQLLSAIPGLKSPGMYALFKTLGLLRS